MEKTMQMFEMGREVGKMKWKRNGELVWKHSQQDNKSPFLNFNFTFGFPIK